MTETKFGSNIALGSKRFEEQRAFWKRNGPGTLIRSRDYTNRAGGGERRETGRIRRESLSIRSRIERIDLEGSKRPRRGAEVRGMVEVAKLESGNGLAAPISPEPGLTGESEEAASRTGLTKVLQAIEAAGRELRSRNGGLETGSRSGGAKGRCEMPVPARTNVRRPSRH